MVYQQFGYSRRFRNGRPKFTFLSTTPVHRIVVTGNYGNYYFFFELAAGTFHYTLCFTPYDARGIPRVSDTLRLNGKGCEGDFARRTFEGCIA
jgi:hypothetical protein